MATAVHDGVGGGRGTLFRGMKFYLLLQIPMRNRWMKMISDNGGEIVILDTQADIVIADHARKYTPSGSISWTYVDQSVKNGALEDIEKHRAGPAAHVVRDVASGQPMRKGRVSFTPDDDRILMEWCTKAERKGIYLKGNELYKQLEAQHNRHTFQSWRDRWVKIVSLRPRLVLSDTEGEGDDEEDEDEVEKRQTHTSGHSPQARPRIVRQTVVKPPSLVSAPSSKAPARQDVPRPPTGARQGKPSNVFTDEEEQLLLAEHDNIMNLDEDQIIDAWMAWAAENPIHTAQEWRNYFKEYVIPKRRAEDAKKFHRKISPPPIRKLADGPDKPSSSKEEKAQVIEIKDSQDSSGQNLSSPELRKSKVVDPSTRDEALFKQDLRAVADELNVEVDFKPKICGRTIPLFRLWQIVKSPEFGGYDAVDGRRMWPKVASKLNFNSFRDPDAAESLKACYSELLADFENLRDEYYAEPLITDTQMIDDQLLVTAAHESPIEEEVDEVEKDSGEDGDLDAPHISSVQRVVSSSSKRSFGMDRSNGGGLAYNKRQRIDKEKGKELEIPSTPEDVINSNQMPRPSHKPSPLGFPMLPEPASSVSGSGELPVRPLEFHRAQSRQCNLEPETQDFHYLPEDELVQDHQEDNNSFLDLPSSPAPRRAPTSNAATQGSLYTSNNHNNHDDSSTQSQTHSQAWAADMDAYVHSQIRNGIPKETVIEGLEYTTLEQGENAETVMESLLSGEGIPDDIAGVWTTWDDEALEMPADSEEYKEIMKKHGAKRTRKRKEYLEERREVRERDAAAGA